MTSWVFSTPLSPNFEPLLLVFWPLLFFHLLAGAVSNPTKKEERASNNLKYQRLWGKLVANKLMRGRESKVTKKKQRNAFTSNNNPFASSSGWAGWPPTSIQLLITLISSSSWVLGLVFPSSSSESSEGESYEKQKEAVQTDKNMNLISKLIKRGGNNKLPVSLSPNTSSSGSSSFSSLRFPTISSNLAHFVAIRTSYLVKNKIAVKANKICEMEPLSILLKMAHENSRSQMTMW